MPGFEHGLERALSFVVGGIFLACLLKVMRPFTEIGLTGPTFIELIELIKLSGMLSSVLLILATPYWGTLYLIGWLAGMALMAKAGLVGFFDFILYFGVPFFILIFRLSKSAY